MRAPSRDVRYGAFGVLTGVAAVAAGRCGGGACLSCLACAVPGAAVVLVAAAGAWRRGGVARARTPSASPSPAPSGSGSGSGSFTARSDR